MNTKKSKIPAWIAVACVAIGQHVGPGVGGGASLVAFFAKFGVLSFITPFISFAIVTFVVYFVTEYSRRNQISGYADFAASFYRPYGKVFRVLFDIIFLMGFLVAGGNCLAGFGSLYNQFLGINNWVAIAMCIVLVILLCMFGAALLRLASSVMMFAMVGMLVLVAILSFAFGNHDFAAATAASVATIDGAFLGTAIKQGVIYGCTQSAVALSLLSVSDTLSDTKEVKKMCGALFVGNVGVILLQMFTMFGYTTSMDITKETLPVYTIIANLGRGFGWLKYIYVLLISFAILSSVTAVTFAAITRFGRYVKIPNPKVRDALIAIVGLACLIAISSFGLLALAAKGNAICGWAQIPVLVIPPLVLGVYRLRQCKEEKTDVK